MNIAALVDHTVHHKSWGEGRIFKAEDKYVWVDFSTVGEKSFQFPKAFTSFLTLDDAELQSEILEENHRLSEAERKLAETAVKVEPVKLAPEIQTKHSEDNDSVVFNGHILETGNSFRTHAEVFNKCFGYDYKHYQKAYKDMGNGYAVWFPCIAKQGIEGYVSTDEYSGWINTLLDDNKILIQYDKGEYVPGKTDMTKRLVFAKFDGDKRYTFVGVYVPSKRVEKGNEHIRIGTKFDLDSFQVIEEE